MGGHACFFPGGVDAFPVEAGPFHHHPVDSEVDEPGHQRLQVVHEATQGALRPGDAAGIAFDQDRASREPTVDLESGDTAGKRWPEVSPRRDRVATDARGETWGMPAQKPWVLHG